MAANIDPRQQEFSLEQLADELRNRARSGKFSPEQLDILDSIFTERGFGELLPKTPALLAEDRIDSLMSSVFGEEQVVEEELPAEELPVAPPGVEPTLPLEAQQQVVPTDIPQPPLAVAEPESTLPITPVEPKPFVGGVIKEEDIPVFLRKAYNESIVGMAETIATGEPPFDLSGMETTQLEDIASTIAGFLMPVDLFTFLAGGGIGGLAFKGALKATFLKTISKKVTEKLVKSGLSKQLAETTAIKGVNNIVQRLGGKTVITAVAGEIAEKATIGGTALGIFESARGALADKIEKDEVLVSDVLGHFGSGFTLGATAAIGGTAGKALGAIGGRITAFIGELGGEVISFGTLGAAMEGRSPTKDDYLNAAGVIVGMRAAHLTGRALKGAVKNISEKIQSSVNDGKSFKDAVNESLVETGKIVDQLTIRLREQGEKLKEKPVVPETIDPRTVISIKDAKNLSLESQVDILIDLGYSEASLFKFSGKGRAKIISDQIPPTTEQRSTEKVPVITPLRPQKKSIKATREVIEEKIVQFEKEIPDKIDLLLERAKKGEDITSELEELGKRIKPKREKGDVEEVVPTPKEEVPVTEVKKAKETPPERALPLKMASQQEATAKAKELGLEFAGFQGKELMLFNDPKTKSTISVKNLDELKTKLEVSREKFGIKKEVEDVEARKEEAEPTEKIITEEVVEAPTAEEAVVKKAFEALREGKIVNSSFPKYARSINLERQSIPDKIKQFEVEVGKLKPKKVQTWDETGELSKEILKDYKKSNKVLRKAKKGEALNAEETEVARQINIDSISKLKELAETGGLEEFKTSFEQYVEDVFMPVSDASSVAGRVLNSYKKSVSMSQIARSFARLKRGLNERELEQFKRLDLENPEAVKKFIDEMGDPKLRDYMYQFWYNSILAGIPTHLVNVISNTGWAIFQVPHRGLTAGVDAMITKFTGKKRTRYLKEMVPMLSGHKNSFFKGAKRAGELIRTNKVAESETKWSLDIGTKNVSAFERSPYKPLRAIAPFLSAPTRALRAMDVWANSMAFDAQLNALARREGLNNGLKGEALKQFEKDLLSNPSDKMLTDAALFARHSTFMDEPGKFTQWILKGRDIVPGGRFVIPFVNTISNLFKRGIELTPGLGLTLARNRPIAEVIANQIEGSILGLYILKLADEERVTGAAPKNKTEREAFFRQGKIPWAIKFGDTWYSYRRIEPFNTVIASVAIAYDKIKNAKDDETATQIFGNMVDALLENLIDSSYFNGLTNLLDRFGRRTGMFQRHLASFVPYSSFWRSINRAYEVATEGETKVRETKSLLGAFAQVIPGMSDKVPARLNVWGEEIILPGGILRQWLPYKSSEIKNDPVEVELERLTIYPGLPSKNVTINKEKIEFPDDFYRNYLLDFGRITKAEISRIINSPDYRKLSDDNKRLLLDRRITQVRNAARTAAKIRFLKNSE